MEIDEKGTEGLIEIFQRPYGRCVNKQPIVGLAVCVGPCNSGTAINRQSMKQVDKCTCCSPSQYEKLKVDLHCQDGSKQKVFVPVPTSCSCKACDGNNNEHPNEESLRIDDQSETQEEEEEEGGGVMNGLSFFLNNFANLARQHQEFADLGDQQESPSSLDDGLDLSQGFRISFN